MANEHNALWAEAFAADLEVPVDSYSRPFSGSDADVSGPASDALALAVGTSPLSVTQAPAPSSREDAHAEWEAAAARDFALALGDVSPEPIGAPFFSGKNSADLAIEAAGEVAESLALQSNDSIFGVGDSIEAALTENEGVGRLDMAKRRAEPAVQPTLARKLSR